MSGTGQAWPWLRRVAFTIFLGVVGVLLVRHARTVEWDRVLESLSAYEPATIAAAATIAVASHLVYACFDVLARAQVAHGLGALRTLRIAAVAYAFNLNLGALVGGVGFRYRLYARSGLGAGTVARVYVFAVVTNWSGYLLVLGAVLAAGVVSVPPSWTQSWASGLAASRVLGAVLVALAVAWLALCKLSPRREWTVRGTTIELPSIRMAAVQLALSAANWLLMALLVHVLLRGQADYLTVLGTLLLAAVAGAVAHIPGGLGVLEAVFVVMLGAGMPEHEILAALLAYRALYYIAPLLVALLNYAALEVRAPASRQAGDPAARNA